MNTILKAADYVRLETTYNFIPNINHINFINNMLQSILMEASKHYAAAGDKKEAEAVGSRYFRIPFTRQPENGHEVKGW